MIPLYHGSLSDFDRIDLSKCRDSRDFGRGFYLSADIGHAEKFAESRKRKLNRIYQKQHMMKKIVAYRYNFIFDDEKAARNLNIRKFDHANRQWLRFVTENRRSDYLNHQFDIVIGPTADAAAYSVIMDAYDDLIQSDYNEDLCDEVIRELHPERLSGQYCFCTEDSLFYLSFADPRREIIYEQV